MRYLSAFCTGWCLGLAFIALYAHNMFGFAVDLAGFIINLFFYLSFLKESR